MIVKVPALSGFCPGVKRAEKRLLAELAAFPEGQRAILGMMINNRKYIAYLATLGIETEEDPARLKENAKVFIRTHGIKKSLEEELSKRFPLIDLTCRNVKKVQLIIEEKSKEGALVIITGKRTHPEVIGLESYATASVIIETMEDLEKFLDEKGTQDPRLDPERFPSLFVTSQTTGSPDLFFTVIDRIKEQWPECHVESFNSICPVTKRKEKDSLLLQKEVDITFVLGDRLSSNATKLFALLKAANQETYFIEDLDELLGLGLDLSTRRTALVVSSASTPGFIEEEVVEYLENPFSSASTRGKHRH